MRCRYVYSIGQTTAAVRAIVCSYWQTIGMRGRAEHKVASRLRPHEPSWYYLTCRCPTWDLSTATRSAPLQLLIALSPERLNITEKIMTKLLNLVEVAAHLRLSRTTIYRLLAQNRFPEPRRLSRARVVWAESDIEAWLDQKGGQHVG
jgi:prophage regulatory protein